MRHSKSQSFNINHSPNCVLNSPSHAQRVVHLCAVFLHWYRFTQPFLHLQDTSSWQVSAACGKLVQCGCYILSSFSLHHHLVGGRSLGAASSAGHMASQLVGSLRCAPGMVGGISWTLLFHRNLAGLVDIDTDAGSIIQQDDEPLVDCFHNLRCLWPPTASEVRWCALDWKDITYSSSCLLAMSSTAGQIHIQPERGISPLPSLVRGRWLFNVQIDTADSS